MVVLRRIREKRGMSQQELAQRAKVPQQTISMIESGQRPDPRIGTLGRLADALGCTVLDLWVPDEESDNVDGFGEVAGDG